MAPLASGNATASLSADSRAQARGRFRRRLTLLPSVIGTLPMAATAIGVFIVCIIFTIVWSFTSSKLFPTFNFVGLEQYERLWKTPKWLVSVSNIWIYGILTVGFNMIAGFILAVFMDQRIRHESVFRTIFLYPFALSAVVTGLVWQWMMDPNLGIQRTVNLLGFTDFRFAPIAQAETALAGLVIASVWNGVGVTMAILIAGLRGVDQEVWKAARVDGIPPWRFYLFIALPMMRGAIATAFVLQAVGVIRVFDLVIAMTGGGPGIATQMPAVYVVQAIGARVVGQGMAAATMMLIPIAAFVIAQKIYKSVVALRASK